MSDNKQLPPTGTGTADIVTRTKDRAGIDTPIVALDINPAGSEVLGTGDATNGMDVDVTRVSESHSSAATATWTSATAANSTLELDCTAYGTTILRLKSDGGTCSAGVYGVDVSDDGGTTWDASVSQAQDAGVNWSSTIITSAPLDGELTYFDSLAVALEIRLNTAGYTRVRVQLYQVITGTISLGVRLQGATIAGGPFGVYSVFPLTVHGDAADSAHTLPPVGVAGSDGTNARRLKTDADGNLQTDVLTVPADPFGTNADAASATGSMSAKLRSIAAVQLPAALAANGGLKVEGVAGGVAQPVSLATLPALVAGTANIGDVDVLTLPNVTIGTMAALVAGTANIGDVDVLTVPAPLNVSGPGSVATAQRVAQGFPAAIYYYNIVSQVHVNSANTVHWDLFNADAALVVRVLTIRQIPNITTAVTGIVFDWLLERTTAVGTGGSTVTAWLADLNDTALDADITCRSKPTGGATQSTDLFNYSLSSEETNAATIQIASQGGLELVPPYLGAAWGGKGIVLRQNQGLRCVQITASAAGNTGWLIGFTVE